MRIRLVAVVGSGSKLSPDQTATAEALGAALMRAGFGVVCGGLGGVMEAVARGAHVARGDVAGPPVVGILPGYDVTGGNRYLDLVVPTGMGHARNVLVAAAGEVVICVGGAMGAMSEMAIARKIGRPVLALAGSGGAAKVMTKAVQTVIAVETPEEAVEKVKELLRGPKT